MGIGKALKKAVGITSVGNNFAGTSRNILGGKGGFGYNKPNNDGTVSVPTEQEITTANLFQSLSPEQKKDLLLNNPNIYTPQGSQIYDPLTNSVRLNESDFTKAERLRQESLSSQLTSSLSGDFSNNGQAIQDATFQRGKAQIDPIVKQQKRDLAQQLADQGIPAGSEQYNEAMNRMDNSVARQYTDLSQASIATGEQVRQSRFNEISSLLGRSQVGAGTSFGGYKPDYNGIDLAGFAQQSNIQNQQISFLGTQAQKDRNATRTNALIGAFGSLGGAAIGAPKGTFSDITLKENIRQTGVSPSGIVIYEFDYKDKSHGQFRYSGVMAQDLLETHPSAVIQEKDGTLKVDYSQIDVNFRRVK
tara:strand:- start:3912 stop:4994 length:1083 start_codon:yes stop_codon:yes gene_type:complete